MIDVRNPYTPGAGMSPKYLAGRENILQDAQHRLEAISSQYLERSIVYYGLRGVGKTVLLNEIERYAENRNMLHCFIEVKEQSNFVKLLSLSCNKFIHSLSATATLKDGLTKLWSAAKSFTAKWNPEDKSFEVGLSDVVHEPVVAGTGDLASDFTELLVTLGRYAQQSENSICFCIDEMQYATNTELEALVTALHRVNQLGLPIIFFCAGLSKILNTLGNVKSYAERLFIFSEIDSLSSEAARDAIVMPALQLDVEYTEDAIQAICEYTGGYPYFIQELCSTIWKHHTTKIIDADVVHRYNDIAIQILDASFFRVRYMRCTPLEKKFIEAMVDCGKLPCTIANIAANMQRSPNSIAPLRAKLINKGLICAAGHGEVNFTVPKFTEFILRMREQENATSV